MFKETVICIIIVIAIFSLDMFTQNYTNHAVADISDRFSSLRENILKEDKDQMDEELKKLDENWNEMHDKLAYYIEHDELEKVDTAIVDAKSFVETEDYPSAVSEIDKAKFVMEHIKRKYAFNLQNIF